MSLCQYEAYEATDGSTGSVYTRLVYCVSPVRQGWRPVTGMLGIFLTTCGASLVFRGGYLATNTLHTVFG